MFWYFEIILKILFFRKYAFGKNVEVLLPTGNWGQENDAGTRDGVSQV